MFDRGIQVSRAKQRQVRMYHLQQVGKNPVNPSDLQMNILDHQTRRAGDRQVAANDFDDAGNTCERITDFVSESGS